MPELIERVPGTRFLVAGSGTHEDELKKQATELGLMDHGTFLGWIGDDVLHLLYRIADVCVVPSIYEPFGLVALEAMASGCPCIVADTGGLREVVPHGEVGLRFRTRDPEALGGMVERVLTDAELRESLIAEAERARPPLRLVRRRPPHRRGLRGAGDAGSRRRGDRRTRSAPRGPRARTRRAARPRSRSRPAAPMPARGRARSRPSAGRT